MGHVNDAGESVKLENEGERRPIVKLIALDLDGTLLNPDSSISEETIKQMRRLSENCCQIAIVTGNPYSVTLEHLIRNNIRTNDGFPQILICNERDVFFLEGDRYRPWLPWNEEAYNKELSLLPSSRQVVKEIALAVKSEFHMSNDYMQNDRGFLEIFYSSPERAKQACSHFAEALKGPKIKPVRNNAMIAFRSEEIGKGLILSMVADHLGLQVDVILEVGDCQNDVCMLLRCKAASTQNADHLVKELVRQRNGVVADSSYSSGVAEILALF